MPAQAPRPVEMDDETLQRLMFRKALARKKRKEREAAGEIHELNITAMMDMMTIILVFLLKSYAASALMLTQSARTSSRRSPAPAPSPRTRWR